MRKIDETQLPGVGVRHDFETHDGARIGVISHRSGRKELLVYAEDDPDTCSTTLWLGEDEGHALAEMLGGTTVSAHLGALAQEVEGLAIDWVRVSDRSAVVGRPLSDLAALAERSALVVAVQRGDAMHPAPGADFGVEGGDVAVLVGRPEGVDRLAAVLRGEG